MEKYTIIKYLGHGALGKSYLTNHSVLGELVLKKIECCDEAHVYHAFNQLKKAYNLEHPYICKCREIFVDWDKKECAVYLCVSINYYSCGTMSSYLLGQRDIVKEYLKEDKIRHWLGQIIEAMLFLNDSNIDHMDIKCNNLYLQSDMTIVLGDMGVPLIMNELLSLPDHRIENSCKLTFAPETETSNFISKSDVWSLGIVALEMASCGYLNSQGIQNLIILAKQDEYALSDFLTAISGVYSRALVYFIKSSLIINPNERPSLESLSGFTFTKQALSLSGSAVVERKKHQEATTVEYPVPTENGFEDVIEYLAENSVNEFCVKEALQWLVSECSTFDFQNSHKLNIVQAVRENIVCEDICRNFLKIFSHHIIYAQENDAVYSKEVVEVTVLAMNTHSQDLDLQLLACSFFMALSESAEASDLIGQEGGIQCLLNAIIMFPDSVNLFMVASDALWSLCVVDSNNLIATQNEALKIISEGMIQHSGLPEAIENASLCILSLCTHETNFREALNINMPYHLLNSLKNFLSYTKLAKNILATLSSYSEVSETCALELFKCETETKGTYLYGAPIIMKVYEIHKDNIEVIEHLAQLMVSLFQHRDIVQVQDQYQIDFNDIKSIVTEMFNRYSSCDIVLRAYQTVCFSN